MIKTLWRLAISFKINSWILTLFFKVQHNLTPISSEASPPMTLSLNPLQLHWSPCLFFIYIPHSTCLRALNVYHPGLESSSYSYPLGTVSVIFHFTQASVQMSPLQKEIPETPFLTQDSFLFFLFSTLFLLIKKFDALTICLFVIFLIPF